MNALLEEQELTSSDNEMRECVKVRVNGKCHPCNCFFHVSCIERMRIIRTCIGERLMCIE